MVWQNPSQPGESQLQRHAASHLPDGADPIFTVTADAGPGPQVIVFNNGTWSVTNLSSVVQQYLSALFGGMSANDPGEDGPPGPPGLKGDTGATGATGASGASGSGGGIPGMDGEPGDDGWFIPGNTGATGAAGASGGGGAGTTDDILVIAYAVAL